VLTGSGLGQQNASTRRCCSPIRNFNISGPSCPPFTPLFSIEKARALLGYPPAFDPTTRSRGLHIGDADYAVSRRRTRLNLRSL
jgi:hypothetical protein